MAITYVGGATAIGAASVATITYPVGIQAGDVMVMAVTWKRGTGTFFFVPPGWTLWERAEGATVTYQNMLLTAVADGSESGRNLVVNDGATAGQDIAVAVSVYRGAHVVPRTRNMVTANAGGTDTSVECTDPGGNQAGDRRIVCALARGSLNGPSGSPSFPAVTAGFTIRQQITSTQASQQNAAVAIADGTGTGTVTFTATASTYSVGATMWLREGAPGAHSIFTSQVPAGTNSNDSSPYTLATCFYPTTDGYVTHARWRFPTTLPTGAAGGSVTAGLWEMTSDTTGTLLATTSFISPTAGAWNETAFTTPVTVTNGKAYVIGIYTPDRYVGTSGVFTSAGITNGYLVAPQNGADPLGLGTLLNGRLHSGGAGLTWPEAAFAASNYFADVVFVAAPQPAAPNRLYLTSATPEYTPATIRGSWTNATTTTAWKLGKRPEGEATTSARADTVTTNPNNVLLGRWVSHGALKAGTIAGSMNWCMGVLESNAAMNAFFRFHVFVLAGDTDTVRGVLRTEIVNSTEWISSSPVGRTGNNWTLTSTAIQAGDRLVVEVGYSAQNSVSTSYTGTIYFGTQGALDLSLADPNVTALPGWLEFTDGEGLWWDAAGDLTDNFNDGVLDTTDTWGNAWTAGGTPPIETGGRCRIYCNTGYAGITTLPWLYFRDTSASWEMTTLANGATATAECYFKGSVDSYQAGRYIGWFLNLKTDELQARSAVDFADNSAVVVSFNATDHRWLQLRESNGTVYWETSADGTTWTVQRSAPTPYWCSYKDIGLGFDAHRDTGSEDYFEIDNVNTGPPEDETYFASATDTADVVDAVAAGLTRARTTADGAGLLDAVAAGLTRARTTADIVQVDDAATRASARLRAVADTVDVADTVVAAQALLRSAADTVDVADTVVGAQALLRSAADAVDVADTAVAAGTRARDAADTAGVDDTAAAGLGRPRHAADSAGISDSIQTSMAAGTSATDSADIGDQVTAALDRSRQVADTAAVNDQASGAVSRARVQADTVGIGDAHQVQLGKRAAVVDTAGLLDAVTVTGAKSRTPADTAGLLDTATVTAVRVRSVVDTAGIGDQVAAVNGKKFTPNDVAGAVDGLTTAAGRVRAPSDAAGIVDAVQAHLGRARAVADQVATADAALAGQGRAGAPADTAAFADAVAWQIVAGRTVEDTVALVDAVQRTFVTGRTTTDGAGLVDAVAVVVHRGVSARPHRIVLTRFPGSVVNDTNRSGQTRVVATVAPGRVGRTA